MRRPHACSPPFPGQRLIVCLFQNYYVEDLRPLTEGSKRCGVRGLFLFCFKSLHRIFVFWEAGSTVLTSAQKKKHFCLIDAGVFCFFCSVSIILQSPRHPAAQEVFQGGGIGEEFTGKCGERDQDCGPLEGVP